MITIFATLVQEFDRASVQQWALERKWTSDRNPDFTHIEARYQFLWQKVKTHEELKDSKESKKCCSK